ncbi:MAG: hypothetical protein N2515_02725 [Deltaproteobacteria bacterium]|nr:hypothetical protein [Sandaracinaceae bacterium]MCX7807499.1 hypothetical protein [Deltaproteobacteria bacterium]MDW8245127.1 hypothetical protein [Sandaracinaceae bacterium]
MMKDWKSTICFVWIALFALIWGWEAHAQVDASEERSTSFRAVQGAVREDIPGGPLLIAAYGLVLTLLVAYAIHLGRLSGGALRQIERLEKALKRSDQPPEHRSE